ncbi:MAG: hypothetical protein SV487_01655 [Thermodesulfobacteriota bacterium]|nr:hypothetical protein [Thermodesulfobacteriota bacterium]
MILNVRCFNCGANKTIATGTTVKLVCEQCSSAKVILGKSATFKCVLCGRTFRLPGGCQVPAYHDREDCLGRFLILLDHD